MSDNLCGPSNALKSLGDHVNRDRSLHQDRPGASIGRPGPSNFRSSPTINHNAEAEFQAFTSGAVPFQAEPMLGHPDLHLHGPGPAPPSAFQQMQHGCPAAFAGSVAPAHMARGPGPQAGPSQHHQWAAEFASGAANASGLPGHQQQQPTQAVNRLQHFSTGMATGPHAPIYSADFAAGPSFSPSTFPNNNQLYFARNNNLAAPTSVLGMAPAGSASSISAAATTTTTASSQRDPTALSGVGGLTEGELEARFAAAQAEMDFQDEMNSWMASHGPTAEESTTAQEQQIDADLEELADELDAQRLSDASGLAESETLVADDAEATQAQERDRDADELARVAGDIVTTLGAHPSSRFQSSSFMHLMRRMESREVTVRGDSLVEEATGRPLEVVVQTNEQTQQEQQMQQGA